MDSNDNNDLRFHILIPDELIGVMALTPDAVDGPQLLVLSKTSVGKEQEDTFLNRMRRSLKKTAKEFPSRLADVKDIHDSSARKIFNQTEGTFYI